MTGFLSGLRGRGRADRAADPKVGMGLRFTPWVAIVAVLAYAGAGRFPNAEFFSIFGIGLIITAAAGMVGVLLGFLFALPQTSSDHVEARRLTTNTNLGQVSDWLTKILVGLGLVQIGKIGSGLDGLAETVAPGLGGAKDAKTVALGLLVYSLIDGFLIGYLGTRLVVTIRFKDVEDLLAAKEEVLREPAPESLPPLPPPPPGLPAAPVGGPEPPAEPEEAPAQPEEAPAQPEEPPAQPEEPPAQPEDVQEEHRP